MKKTIQLLFVLCVLCLFSQKSTAQHQISIQSSAFDYFFDRIPINALNSKASRCLQYQFQKPSQRLITAQLNTFINHRDWKYIPTNSDIYATRRIIETNVTFSKQINLAKHFNWTYGAGASLRTQKFNTDTVEINDYPFYHNFYQGQHLQLGVKGQTSLTYTPFKWITLITQMNLCAYAISTPLSQNFNDEILNDFKNSQRFNFPSRFHFSLTFGVGINF